MRLFLDEYFDDSLRVKRIQMHSADVCQGVQMLGNDAKQNVSEACRVCEEVENSWGFNPH